MPAGRSCDGLDGDPEALSVPVAADEERDEIRLLDSPASPHRPACIRIGVEDRSVHPVRDHAHRAPTCAERTRPAPPGPRARRPPGAASPPAGSSGARPGGRRGRRATRSGDSRGSRGRCGASRCARGTPHGRSARSRRRRPRDDRPGRVARRPRRLRRSSTVASTKNHGKASVKGRLRVPEPARRAAPVVGDRAPPGDHRDPRPALQKPRPRAFEAAAPCRPGRRPRGRRV